jgi:hypothetical protein
LTIPETLLVFVGIPAAVIALIYGLVYAGSAAHSKRYRPGRPFNQAAVWYVANKPGDAVRGSSAHELGAGSAAYAISGSTAAGGTRSEGTQSGSSTSTHATSGAHAADDATTTADGTDDGTGLTTVGYGETGGASDSW